MGISHVLRGRKRAAISAVCAPFKRAAQAGSELADTGQHLFLCLRLRRLHGDFDEGSKPLAPGLRRRIDGIRAGDLHAAIRCRLRRLREGIPGEPMGSIRGRPIRAGSRMLGQSRTDRSRPTRSDPRGDRHPVGPVRIDRRCGVMPWLVFMRIGIAPLRCMPITRSHCGRRRRTAGNQSRDDDAAGRDEGRAERRENNGRCLARKNRLPRHDGTRDDTRIGQCRILRTARNRFAVAREVILQLLALGPRLAFESAQLHFAFIGLRDDTHLRIKRRFQRLDTGGGNARFVFENADRTLCGSGDLLVEIGELGAQFQNARVPGQQCALLERDLGTQVDALLDQPTDQFVAGDIGNLEGPALGDHRTQQLRPGLRIGLGRAGFREPRVEVAQLLRRNAGAVAAQEQPRGSAKRFHGSFRLAHTLTQILDIGAEPVRSGPRKVGLRLLQLVEIDLGDGVCGPGGEIGIR